MPPERVVVFRVFEMSSDGDGCVRCKYCAMTLGDPSRPDPETKRRTIGRIRLYLEAAADNLDRAFDHLEIMSDQQGL